MSICISTHKMHENCYLHSLQPLHKSIYVSIRYLVWVNVHCDYRLNTVATEKQHEVLKCTVRAHETPTYFNLWVLRNQQHISINYKHISINYKHIKLKQITTYKQVKQWILNSVMWSGILSPNNESGRFKKLYIHIYF